MIGHSGLLLEGGSPVNRHNHHADNVRLSPYLATTIDQALCLLLDALGLPQGRVIVRNIERLCCYDRPAGRFSVILSGIGLRDDALSLSLLVLDEQAQICVKADRVSLHLDEPALASIDRGHDWLAGAVEAADRPIAAIARPQLEPTGRPAAASTAARGTGPKADDRAPGRGERILAFIQQELRGKLGFAAQEIGASAQVHDLGLDSIMVVQLTDSVNKRFGTKLMPDLFYEKQQLGELAARLETLEAGSLESEAPHLA
ncbi:phosphopantetheine-binding protein [Ralstonia syzygii subsp. celebesensis]|uniref:phosphopantetheine-binding protein n=1 Tax=Ralstonia syzygii TaxID=28097 RepID=UPI00387E116B